MSLIPLNFPNKVEKMFYYAFFFLIISSCNSSEVDPLGYILYCPCMGKNYITQVGSNFIEISWI